MDQKRDIPISIATYDRLVARGWNQYEIAELVEGLIVEELDKPPGRQWVEVPSDNLESFKVPKVTK